jgi:hypothetical protein
MYKHMQNSVEFLKNVKVDINVMIW